MSAATSSFYGFNARIGDIIEEITAGINDLQEYYNDNDSLEEITEETTVIDEDKY